MNLAAEGAALSEARQASGGLTEHDVAVAAENHCLRVAVDSRDLQAAGALDIHEEAVGGLDHALQLVLGLLLLGARVEQVDIHGLPMFLSCASCCE